MQQGMRRRKSQNSAHDTGKFIKVANQTYERTHTFTHTHTYILSCQHCRTLWHEYPLAAAAADSVCGTSI